MDTKIKFNYIEVTKHLPGILTGSLLWVETVELDPLSVKHFGSKVRDLAEDAITAHIENAMFNWVLTHCPGRLHSYYQRRRHEEYIQRGR